MARRLATALALTGAAVGLYYARRELNDPPDATGSAVALTPRRAPIGAAPDAQVLWRHGDPQWVRDLGSWLPEPPRSGPGRMLAYAWALPATLGGLLIGLLSGGWPEVRDGILLFADLGGLPGLLLRRSRFAATTLGHVVLAQNQPSTTLMAHELVHTRQAERLGPLMGPLYWYLLLRYGYARHPMERAARVAGRRTRPAPAA